MTLKEFRKLLHKCNPEAEVVYSLISGESIRNCTVAVVEENPTDDGHTAEPKINVVLNIRKEK